VRCLDTFFLFSPSPSNKPCSSVSLTNRKQQHQLQLLFSQIPAACLPTAASFNT
jgi:hypothetical protein